MLFLDYRDARPIYTQICDGIRGGEEFYEQNFYIGFGNPLSGIKMSEMYICPESYEIMENGCDYMVKEQLRKRKARK